MKKNFLSCMVIAAVMIFMAGCGDGTEDLENQLVTPQTIGEGASGEEIEAVGKEESGSVGTEGTGTEPAGEEEGAGSTKQPEAEGASEADAGDAAYYGTWEVRDYQFAEVSAISSKEAAQLVSSTVTYGADGIAVNQEKLDLGEIMYEGNPITEEELIRDFKANLGEWWNGKEQVTLISVSGKESFFGDCFVLADEETIWIFHEGAFFLAKKVQ